MTSAVKAPVSVFQMSKRSLSDMEDVPQVTAGTWQDQRFWPQAPALFTIPALHSKESVLLGNTEPLASKYFQKSMSIRTKARLNELWAGMFWYLRGKEGFNSKHFLKGDTLEIQLKEQRAVDCPGRENKVGTSIFSWVYSDIPTVMEWIFYSVSQRKRSRDETWQGGLRLDGTKNVSGNEGVKYQTISLKEVVKCRFFFFPLGWF